MTGRDPGVFPMDSTSGLIPKKGGWTLRLGSGGRHALQCNALACIGSVLGVISQWVLWICQGGGLSGVMVPAAGGLLLSPAAPLAGAHRFVGLCLVVAVILGPLEGAVNPKDILEGTVVWLAGSACRLVLDYVVMGLVDPDCGCAYCVGCAPRIAQAA